MKIKQYFISIILLATFYFLTSASGANAATLFAESAPQQVFVGQSFVVDWFINTEGDDLNAVDLDLHFTKDTLAASEATAGNSIISLWIQPPQFSNEDGTIHLVGGVPAGFRGERIPLMRTVFRVIAAGNAAISMDPKSQILRNDGSGTPAELVFPMLRFVTLDASQRPMTVQSSTHPDSDTWYRANKVIIVFSPTALEEYSYSFSSNIEVTPDDTSDTYSSRFEYADLPDGIYYFKVNSRVGSSPWQEASVFRVQIDQTPPESFDPVVVRDENIYGGKSFVTFSTVDKTSGILHYSVGDGLFGIRHVVSAPYLLKRSLFGTSIAVEAIDYAGNIRKASISFTGYISELWQLIVIILALALVVAVVVRRRKR